MDFPIKHGDFPMKNGDLPMKNGDFPMKNGDFPSLCGCLPGRVMEIYIPWISRRRGASALKRRLETWKVASM